MIKICRGLLVVFTITQFQSACSQPAKPVRLVDKGKSPYQIAISPKATDVDIKAAAELQKYIEKISAVLIPIVKSDEMGEHAVWIGSRGNHDIKSLPVDWDALDDDGFSIKTVGQKIIIAGGKEKGSLYGVYTFLEKYLGCRKYAPDAGFIPKNESIGLDEINDTQVPKIRFRDAYFYEPPFVEWHKLDTHDSLFGMYVHTFRTLVPPEKYFAGHPEYFSKVKSGRIPDGQLCLTNSDVFDIVVRELREQMVQKPDRRYWSVSQNDTFSPCECDSCRAINTFAGSPSGSLLLFVNRVADEFPDKIISTLAYQYSRPAPKNMVPRPNVNIMLCSIECNRSKPLERDPGSVSFVKDVNDWTRLTNNIYLWDYVIDFRNFLCPFPNLRVLQPNIKYFAKNNIINVFEQGSGKSRSEFRELRTYLIAKLLWDPDIDLSAVMDDFLGGYYGKAAPFIRRYIDSMHDALGLSGEELWIYGYPLPSESGYLSTKMLDLYGEFFDDAEKAVAGDQEKLTRVYAARLPLQFTLLEQAKVFGTGERGFFERGAGNSWSVKPGMERLLGLFVERCNEFGFSAIEEMGTTPDQYCQTVERYIQKSMKENLALGKIVSMKTCPSKKYHNGEVQAITDGLRGWEDYHMNWVGFEGEEMEAVVDLGSVKKVKRIGIDFLQDINSWIFIPSDVEFAVSGDGNYYTRVGKIKNPSDERKNGAFIQSFQSEFEIREARYVRIRTTSLKTCPLWHKGAGGLAWIFADEIIVE